MISITCQRCGTTNVTSDAQIESRHRTSEGIVVYARCANGHSMVHLCEPAYPFPPPPPSVLALRRNEQEMPSPASGAEA